MQFSQMRISPVVNNSAINTALIRRIGGILVDVELSRKFPNWKMFRDILRRSGYYSWYLINKASFIPPQAMLIRFHERQPDHKLHVAKLGRDVNTINSLWKIFSYVRERVRRHPGWRWIACVRFLMLSTRVDPRCRDVREDVRVGEVLEGISGKARQ